MLKNSNNLVCISVGDACDGSWCTIVVDAVDESGIVESDKVVVGKSSSVWVVGKFLHELKRRAIKRYSTDGIVRLASGKCED